MLKARYGSGEYFKEIEIGFKSGVKMFPASVKNEDGRLMMLFAGRMSDFSWNDITRIAADYDGLRLIYRERGTDCVITADDRSVTMKYEDNAKADLNLTATVGEREYLIAPPKANALLTQIGIMGKNGKIKNDYVRKYNQIDHFVELASDYLKRLDGEIEVLDCACGKAIFHLP